MQTIHVSSFGELSERLLPDADRKFFHHWKNSPKRDPGCRGSFEPGKSGTHEISKYLFRGEPGVFPSSFSSWGRMDAARSFNAEEIRQLEDLTELATVAVNVYIEDPFRAIGWPQHYGFPTYYVDLTSDPAVALHFAADAGKEASPKSRVVYRIDLEAIEDKVYSKAGAQTPLMAAQIHHLGYRRPARQRAWVIGGRDRSDRYDLQACAHLSPHTVRYEVDGHDAADFLQSGLLSAEDDRCASWPLAILRAIKFCFGGPLPRRLVEWICPRIPLFDPTPAEVTFNEAGLGRRVRFASPNEGQERGGGPYAVKLDDAIDELTSARPRVPNGLIVGIPVGGEPGETRQIEPGDEFQVAWLNELHDWSRVPLPDRVELR